MGYTTNQLYNKVYERVNTIYDTFKGFFGEEHVDLHASMSDTVLKLGINQFLEEKGIQVDYNDATYDIEYPVTDTMVCELQSKYAESKATIYVWWSEVTITNENNRSTKIQDLYAQIQVRFDGTIPLENYGFLLNRATYTKTQFLCNYMHSHIKSIPKHNFAVFMQPCLGRGPIKNTILSLKTDYDEALWMLFCQELSMYVTVESLHGIPYHYLEQLHRSKYSSTEYVNYNLDNANAGAFLTCFGQDQFRAFIKYYLQHGHLSLSYINQKFTCTLSYPEFIVDISNAFIDYYNKYLATDSQSIIDCYTNKLLYNMILDNGSFYRERDTSVNPSSLNIYENRYVLTFKGKEIKTHIMEDNEGDNIHTVTVLDNKVAMFILRNILRTINYRYKNEHNNTAEGGETPTTSHQRILYI